MNYRQLAIILTIGILSLALRLWLLDKRWINPDEGAHLMDAVFVIDGKVPSVDFNSRQPFYAYTNAVFLKILGISYISGRLLPMVFSLLVGVMVFLIADALYERRVAILSVSIYWLLPLELINSVVVKTEPLTMLLTCLSLYAVILFSQSDNKVWLVMAGIFAAIGYYVRQSALIVPLAVFGYLFIYHKIRFRDIAKDFGFFIIGYTCVFFLALIYFSRIMGLEEFLMGDLSPLGFLSSAAKKIPSLLGISANDSNEIGSQATGASHKQYGLYYTYVRQAIKMHAFLIVGFGFSIFVFSRQFISDQKVHITQHFRSYSLLYLWVLSLLLAYAYYYYTEAFYIDYCREFLPPLVIIFSAWLVHAVPVLKRDKFLERFVILGFCISIAIFFVAPHIKNFMGQGIILGLSITLFTMIYFAADFGSKSRRTAFLFTLTVLALIILFSRQALLANYLSGTISKLILIGIILILPWVFFEGTLRPTIKEYFKFISLVVVLSATTLSLTHSANALTFAYDSMWSPVSLEKTSAYIKSNTHSNDTVMSGAVIWELQSLRRPFLDISHPLIFERPISEKDRQKIEVAIKDKPPDAIIIDGFTEKTYFKQFPWLWNLLAAQYELVHTSGPAIRLVEIYRPKK